MVALAALIAAAGCSAGTSPDAGDGSPASPTVTSTPTPEPISYPEGFNESGYANQTAAIYGHVDALEETSFVSTTTYHFANGEVATITIRADRDADRVRMVLRENGSVEGGAYYADGVRYTYWWDTVQDEGETPYRRAIVFDGQFDQIIHAELADGSVDRTADPALITYEVTGEDDGSITVTEEGLIREYTLFPADDQVDRIEYEVETGGNVTVEEPDWVEDT